MFTVSRLQRNVKPLARQVQRLTSSERPSIPVCGRPSGVLRTRGYATESDSKLGDEARKLADDAAASLNEGQTTNSDSARPFKSISPFLTGLLVLGVGLTVWGLSADIYGVMTMWPKDVRKDLRSGLYAQRKGDPTIAAQYFQRAWDKLKTTPLKDLEPQPLLKTTGVAVALASTLEEAKRPEEAYKIYQEALWQLRTAYLDVPATPEANPSTPPQVPSPTEPSPPPLLSTETLKILSPAEKMRAVALSYKLGDLAHQLHKPTAEEEAWLSWSVQAVLSAMMSSPALNLSSTKMDIGPGAANQGVGANTEALVEEFGLPLWAPMESLAAPFEALASFYSREDQPDYALPLYLQAISILIPPPPNKTSAQDRCRGAQLMGNVADLILRRSISPEAITQAESWAKKGLEITSGARMARGPIEACEVAYAVLLYNFAMIRELSGDDVKARELFTQSLDHSRKIDMAEAMEHAADALRIMDAKRAAGKAV
ncbi:hypothetical protein CVT24_008382 [Panaeolus cyanescens]|uniref:Uncharacterized protein n=1 Tax=Panaeolus cyanescens TaxID=181874 RepID=A0A409WCU7_9AGAR|nr:hypothetical protein CVT24_008382 [Panaeolus cyanescens]